MNLSPAWATNGEGLVCFVFCFYLKELLEVVIKGPD